MPQFHAKPLPPPPPPLRVGCVRTSAANSYTRDRTPVLDPVGLGRVYVRLYIVLQMYILQLYFSSESQAQVSRSAQVLKNLPSSLHVYSLRIVREPRNRSHCVGDVLVSSDSQFTSNSPHFRGNSRPPPAPHHPHESNDGEAGIGLVLVISKRSTTFLIKWVWEISRLPFSRSLLYSLPTYHVTSPTCLVGNLLLRSATTASVTS